MEVQKEEAKQTIEPQFLSQAQTSGVKLSIGQLNKNGHEGTIKDIGRYEINIEENGIIVTLLKREISSLTAPHSLLMVPPPHGAPASAEHGSPDAAQGPKPNIQQDFLDKAIGDKQALTLYLINGQRIKATIEAYDSFTILLKEGEKQHLYYKHAITTINR